MIGRVFADPEKTFRAAQSVVKQPCGLKLKLCDWNVMMIHKKYKLVML